MQPTTTLEWLGMFILFLSALFGAWGGWEARREGRSALKVLLGALGAWALCYAGWAVVPLTPARAWDPSSFDPVAMALRLVEVLGLFVAAMGAGHLVGWTAALAVGVSPSRPSRPE